MKYRAATLFWVAFYTFLIFPLAPLWGEASLPVAETGAPPRILHQPLERPIAAGMPLQIEATVISATPAEVTLLYRRIGTSEYTQLPMKHRGEGHYTAKIAGKEMVPPGLEYFIQASDVSGNSTTFGQPLPPGVLKLIPVTLTVEPIQPDDPELTERVFSSGEGASQERTAAVETPWYKKWWVWTLVGAVAVGVAVAGGGGGGGGGAGRPATGTLTISGAVPNSP